ncbi:MAG: hypothetical protein WA563_18565, partial [Candidatus Acidiferrales bacterium]
FAGFSLDVVSAGETPPRSACMCLLGLSETRFGLFYERLCGAVGQSQVRLLLHGTGRCCAENGAQNENESQTVLEH